MTATDTKLELANRIADALRSRPSLKLRGVGVCSADPDWTCVEAEPLHRSRLDHHGNGGEGWDEDLWNEEYADPMRTAVAKALVDAGIAADSFEVEICEKGHVVVHVR